MRDLARGVRAAGVDAVTCKHPKDVQPCDGIGGHDADPANDQRQSRDEKSDLVAEVLYEEGTDDGTEQTSEWQERGDPRALLLRYGKRCIVAG